MSLRINQNVTSLSTYSNLNRASSRLDKSIGKLSSGLRINSAADDAAGLAISEKMRSQIRGLSRARLNAQDGVSMLQTAEGGLNESESIMQRMRELAIQAANDTLTSNDRLEIQKEINQLTDAIDDIADSTEFNTKKLLNGSQTALISASSSHISGTANGSGVNGGDFNVSMAVVQGGISQMQTSQIFMNKNTGELAKGNTKLEDIAQFYDSNGVFALATAQTITVNGNSATSEFVLDGKMTLNDLASALQNAIAGSSGLGIRNTSAGIVSTAQSGVSGIGGYLQITSGKIGDVGEFSIAGDQAVVDALGMTVSRASANNVVEINTKDASGNMRKVTTSTEVASGLLDGIDLRFDSSAAQIAGNKGIVKGLKFTGAENLTFSFMVGAAARNVTVAFAANSKYSMEGIVAAINKEIEAVEKNTGMAATVVDGQIRLSYNPTDASSPTEIEVTGGSEVIGIGVGSYTGFVDGDKKLANEIQGVSLLNVGQGAAIDMKIEVEDGEANLYELTIGTTITAGADLVEAGELVKTANDNFIDNDVAARMDIVNGSIAFTSTILGNKNTNAGAISGSIKVTASDAYVNSLLGFRDGTANGYGDTNFRMHIVDNTPTFQIGANQGQNMTISISDMSSKALGIDKLDMSTTEGAQKAIGKLDTALATISSERSKLGAFQNRMNYTINNLESTKTNMTESESRIRDLDMASEMTEFTSAQILQQAATSMLAQANASGQSVLQLLQ